MKKPVAGDSPASSLSPCEIPKSLLPIFLKHIAAFIDSLNVVVLARLLPQSHHRRILTASTSAVAASLLSQRQHRLVLAISTPLLQPPAASTRPLLPPDNGIKKNVQGPTFMRKIWARDKQEAIQVEFNDLGQPIDEKSSSELAHFLGAIARNGRYAPLHYKNWIKVPQTYKKEMLTQVQEKFQLPPGQEDWILKSITKKWRNWKSFVKTNYYDPNVSLVEQMKNVPERVHEDQWKELVTFWNSDASKRVSDRNKVSRGHQKMVHRKGKMSFARVAEKKKKELGYYPSRSTLFIECYSKGETPGNEVASQAMVQNRVCLKSINDPTQIVAKGIVRSIDPSTEVGGSRLRPNWCEVHIQVAVEWDEELIRRYGMFETIGDALGAHVAWPLFLVERDESDD
ncbi:uncharacterized protein LOC127811129 [Diospyros lotus]|uniref:uncharacterized protein LOC127811129 n=1 Tax=Diospyros lotus TaxID=55363 RepID=UPI00225503F7|nr:uncharacterized protein LOC127811129 [Diospyros lotus]